jgi:hypothetical protein
VLLRGLILHSASRHPTQSDEAALWKIRHPSPLTRLSVCDRILLSLRLDRTPPKFLVKFVQKRRVYDSIQNRLLPTDVAPQFET